MSGEMQFKARAILHVPEDCNMAELRCDLEKIAADLMVDVSFSNRAPAPRNAAEE